MVPRVLESGENLVASLELDLNHRLEFSTGVVCLTNRGLLASRNGYSLDQLSDRSAWDFWAFDQSLQLRLSDHAGVACLELCDSYQRLAHWRFTLGHNPAANRLVQQYKLELVKSLGQKMLGSFSYGRICFTKVLASFTVSDNYVRDPN